MPIKECPNGKYRIGSGPCVFTSHEKAEKAYKAYLAKKYDNIEEDAMKRGKYQQCTRMLKYIGFTEEEAKIACANYLSDSDDDGYGEDWNLLFVDNKEARDDKIGDLMKNHPDWDYEKVVGVANAYFGYSDAVGDITLRHLLPRSRNITLLKFNKLIRLIKTRKGLKVGGMGMVPQKVELPMKNLNRLQTKLEKQFTQEQRWLTAEEYEKRKQYAKYIRKSDSEEEMSKEEFTDSMVDLYNTITESFPNNTPEEAIELAFEPTSGDKAWIMSNEAEIVSMNDGLNNIIKAPIILAKEMVQPYFDEKGHTEYHFKPYKELQYAAIRANQNGPLDMIIEHQDTYGTDNLIGTVKEIRADDESRTIRGMGYFYEQKLPNGLKEMISNKEVIPVSIGFLAQLGDGGEYNGIEYSHTQKDIILRHFAICLESVARCPAGICGVNLEDSEDVEKDKNIKTFIIINKDSYYYNICKIMQDSKKETNTESNIKKQEEFENMQDSHLETGHIAGVEPADFEAFLTRLRKTGSQNFNGEIHADIVARILAAFDKKEKSDSNMEDKKMNDALKSENESLREKLNDAEKRIKVFEEKERQNFIKQIKKFGDKYSDEELSQEDLKGLEKIADAVSRFAPSTKKPDVLPVEPKDDKEDLTEKVERIDFSRVFDDVNKEFNL